MIPLISATSRAIEWIEKGILSTAILGIAGLTIANVFARSVLNHSLALAEELSQFLIIAVTFVGLSYAAGQGRHIRMTALTDQLPMQRRKLLMIVVTGSTSALLAVLCFYACQYVYGVYQLGGIYPALRVPFYVVYLAAPLGFFLGAVQYALAAIRNVLEPDLYIAFERKETCHALPAAQEPEQTVEPRIPC